MFHSRMIRVINVNTHLQNQNEKWLQSSEFRECRSLVKRTHYSLHSMSSEQRSVCHKIKSNYISFSKAFSAINSISRKQKHQKSIYLSSLRIPKFQILLKYASLLLNKMHKQATKVSNLVRCSKCGGSYMLFAVCSLHDVSTF